MGDSPFQVTPLKSLGTSKIVAEYGGGDIREVARNLWPDLGPDTEYVLMPRADFDALVESTKGQPILSLRPFITFQFPARPS